MRSQAAALRVVINVERHVASSYRAAAPAYSSSSPIASRRKFLIDSPEKPYVTVKSASEICNAVSLTSLDYNS